jgi:hypothetical protein
MLGVMLWGWLSHMVAVNIVFKEHGLPIGFTLW